MHRDCAGGEDVTSLARVQKARVDRCLLGDIASKFVEVYTDTEVREGIQSNVQQ